MRNPWLSDPGYPVAVTSQFMAGYGRSVAATLVSSLALLSLIGCAPERIPLPTPSASPWISTYVTPDPTELAPLRGTTVPAGSLNHASIAAKVDNHWDARPQVGLERTDMLFEELVEGGITRYVAIWQSDIPELLGPVRSIRPMDPDIVSPFAGIICYSGGQQRFVRLMLDTPVYNAIHGQSDTEDTFFRTNDKDGPPRCDRESARSARSAHRPRAASAAVRLLTGRGILDGGQDGHPHLGH